MNKLLSSIEKRYEQNSFEVRARVRLFFYFLSILLPILFVFLIFMNIVVSRPLFHPFNILLFTLLSVIFLCFFLLKMGYYYLATSILSLVAIIGLIFNGYAVTKFGQPARVIGSLFAYILPMILAILFSKWKTFVIVSALAMVGLFLTILSINGIDITLKKVILGSTSIAIVLSFILGLLIIRVNDVAKKLRVAEYDEDREKQLKINRELLESLKDVSEKLEDSSRQMSSHSIDFSENIQKQTASIEEITGTIEEISSGAENVSDNTKIQSFSMNSLMTNMETLYIKTKEMGKSVADAMGRALNISTQAKDGGKYISEMNMSMNEITSTSNAMMGILGIINDISDQINLLSLNAAIEAARAGEAGKGFAVVADEIGKLAEQTSSSVKEIDSLIKKSKQEVQKGMTNVEETVKVIGDIINGVSDITEMMNVINDSMKNNLTLNKEVSDEAASTSSQSEIINLSAEEQKKAAEEIVSSVSLINDITQSNASGSEEILANAEDIMSMSKDLKEKILNFNLDNLK